MGEGYEVARPGVPREVLGLAVVGVGPHVPGPGHLGANPVDHYGKLRLRPALRTRLL